MGVILSVLSSVAAAGIEVAKTGIFVGAQKAKYAAQVAGLSVLDGIIKLPHAVKNGTEKAKETVGNVVNNMKHEK